MITGIVLEERVRKQLDELKADGFLRKPMGIPEFLDVADLLLGYSPAEDAPQPEASTPAEAPLAAAEDDFFVNLVSQAQVPQLAALPTPKPSAARPAADAAEEGLAGLLSGLRGSLGAMAAILLNERGHVVAQAGDLPDAGLLEQFVPSLMAALSAGTHLSYLMGQTTSQSVQAYRGKLFDIVLAPVGQYALLIALKPGRTSLRLALAFEEALHVQGELAEVIEALGLHVQSLAEVPASEVETPPEVIESPFGQDPGLEKFEELFAQKKTGQLDLEDADAFWETASTGEGDALSSAGFLTYEQAQKLGLLPAEDEE